jgi:hypothetical protein
VRSAFLWCSPLLLGQYRRAGVAPIRADPGAKVGERPTRLSDGLRCPLHPLPLTLTGVRAGPAERTMSVSGSIVIPGANCWRVAHARPEREDNQLAYRALTPSRPMHSCWRSMAVACFRVVKGSRDLEKRRSRCLPPLGKHDKISISHNDLSADPRLAHALQYEGPGPQRRRECQRNASS